MILMRDCTKILRAGKRKTTVIEQVSLVVPRDGTTVFLGVQGSGKTTLIRLLAGTMNPTSGSIARDCRVSFPFGSMGYYRPRQKARQVVYHIACVYGADPHTILSFLERLPGFDTILDAEMVEVPATSKISLAYAIGYALDFDMYMMDTGIAAGSPLLRRLCETFYAERSRNSGIVLATSNASTARKLADRIVILNKGRLETYVNKEQALQRFTDISAMATPA